ncbi:hypothetical protein BACCIP111895_00968 [Neobacillus rhizosphaerae]|uniref:DUF4190 domain-containing protein n=1 Tax=Neobacillus rhizosphaerae TaxID=2880965 RepID=A0ABM9EMH3_9BACI|nr:hypothetical protein [Neobacillus rhizosphaerae]CAH2713814.1 hypothetical protein BACCIP111895_00968 [Neobacillus rhizosphaerae]
MYNSQSGSYEVVNTNVCHNCGGLTIKNEELSSDKKLGIAYPMFGWLFFFISLLFIPLLFGAGALIMGFLTYHDRNKIHGAILLFFAAAGLIIGSIFSFMVSGTLFI